MFPIVNAVRESHIPKQIADDGRIFMVFIGSDKKLYQVKFNLESTKGNQNEMITQYMGEKMKAPVLNGCILKFTSSMFSRILNDLKEESPNIDIFCYEKPMLFGIEWYEGAKKAKSEEEVKYFHTMCKNKEAFFSIYSFDQYLRNYDRQYFNHFIVKKEGDGKPSHYATIDGDFIFGSRGWDRLDEEKNLFECFQKDFHKKLYEIVDDMTYKHVITYAGKLYGISDETINNLIDFMNDYYSDIKNEHAKILDILKYRKAQVIDQCDGNCFTNVKYKRLSENGNK